MTTTPLVIYGARGFTAGELLRLLAGHPSLTPALVVSRSAAGEPVGSLQPHVEGCFPDARSGTADDARAYLQATPEAAVALCVGSGEAAPIVKSLGEAGLLEDRVLVDFTGDFRLASAADYPRWYSREHVAPEWLGRFDYCLPELHRDRSSSKLVSNPGCFATAVQLACAPALRAGLVEPDVHVFAITGSSGSGALPRPTTHHPHRAHDLWAYRPLVHQHVPEIRRGLDLDDAFELSLVTHSAPIVRGIQVTASFRLTDPAKAEAFRDAYSAFAQGEPLLRFAPKPPRLTGVLGTNVARLGVATDGAKAVAFCAIDNLCRGAAGQAVQNLNRVLGLPEVSGLTLPGLSPF